jgi:hypothetical protein
VTGSDGALWFVNNTGNSIGRITMSGTITKYTSATISGPIWIAAGSDGALWFTNNTGGTSIGRITTNVTPGITSFAPKKGPVGTQVTITGVNLSGATAVDVNGAPCKITSDSATSIVVKVKAGATTGKITVTTAAGTATSVKNFKVT